MSCFPPIVTNICQNHVLKCEIRIVQKKCEIRLDVIFVLNQW